MTPEARQEFMKAILERTKGLEEIARTWHDSTIRGACARYAAELRDIVRRMEDDPTYTPSEDVLRGF